MNSVQEQKNEKFFSPDHIRKLTVIKTMAELSYVIMNLILKLFKANPADTAYVIRNDELFDVLPPGFLDSISNIDNEHFTSYKFKYQEAVHLFMDQGIFDILYSKYLSDNLPHITLYEYCNKHVRYDLGKLMEKTKKRKESEVNINSKNNLDGTETATDVFFKCLNDEIEKLRISAKFIKLEEKSHALENMRLILTEKIDEKSKNKKGHSEKCLKLLDEYLADFVEHDVFKKERDTIYRTIINQITHEKEMMNAPILREEYLKNGIDFDKFFKDFFTLNERFKKDEEKPKYIWDYFYYHSIPDLIISKPFKRNFRRDKNILYQTFIDDFKRYDSFVESILPKDADNDEDYFNESMEFYYLERYNKLDFIYRLAACVKNIDLTGIEKDRPLVEMLFQGVFWPNMNKLFEEMLQERYNQKVKRPENKVYDDLNLINKLFSFKVAVYELFKLSYVFVPDNYEEISNFIRIRYNMQSYHVKDKDWSDNNRPGEVNKILINNVEKITKALFPGPKVKSEP
jgi:hypothetical protein